MESDNNVKEENKCEHNQFFNFTEDLDEEYELVLPPECEIRSASGGYAPNCGSYTSAFPGCSEYTCGQPDSSDASMGSVLSGGKCGADSGYGIAENETDQPSLGGENRRVSFDTSRNQYFTVERYNKDNENPLFEADDEFQASEFEISLDTAREQDREVYYSKIAHERPPLSNEDSISSEKKIAILEQIESRIQSDRVDIDSQVSSTAGSAVNIAMDDPQDDLPEAVSKSRYAKDRLLQACMSKGEYGRSLEITFSESVSEPDDRKVIVENIPRINNNPFIMKDRMGKS